MWAKSEFPYCLLGASYHPEVIENGYEVHMKLILLRLRPEDYGLYKCVSRNSIGETEGTINVYRKICFVTNLYAEVYKGHYCCRSQPITGLHFSFMPVLGCRSHCRHPSKTILIDIAHRGRIDRFHLYVEVEYLWLLAVEFTSLIFVLNQGTWVADMLKLLMPDTRKNIGR